MCVLAALGLSGCQEIAARPPVLCAPLFRAARSESERRNVEELAALLSDRGLGIALGPVTFGPRLATSARIWPKRFSAALGRFRNALPYFDSSNRLAVAEISADSRVLTVMVYDIGRDGSCAALAGFYAPANVNVCRHRKVAQPHELTPWMSKENLTGWVGGDEVCVPLACGERAVVNAARGGWRYADCGEWSGRPTRPPSWHGYAFPAPGTAFVEWRGGSRAAVVVRDGEVTRLLLLREIPEGVSAHSIVLPASADLRLEEWSVDERFFLASIHYAGEYTVLFDVPACVPVVVDGQTGNLYQIDDRHGIGLGSSLFRYQAAQGLPVEQ